MRAAQHHHDERAVVARERLHPPARAPRPVGEVALQAEIQEARHHDDEQQRERDRHGYGENSTLRKPQVSCSQRGTSSSSARSRSLPTASSTTHHDTTASLSGAEPSSGGSM